MKYRSFAVSSTGPKYADKGWPCQDSVRPERPFSTASDAELRVQVIALADGHGSGDSFRSEIGSRFAVEIAVDTAKQFFEGDCAEESSANGFSFDDSCIEAIKKELWRRWREKVRQDWDSRSALDDTIRWNSVSAKYVARYQADFDNHTEKYLHRAYGTTLLVAISVAGEVLLLQLGDGTAVVLYENGEYEAPVEEDPDCFLNVTTSLCDDEAYKKIRHQKLSSANGIVAVFLSSDGVDDCYPQYSREEDLFRLYSLYIESMLQVGFVQTVDEIERESLPYMTQRGSHDDISIAGFVCESDEALQKAFDAIEQIYRPLPLPSEPDADEEAEEATDDSVSKPLGVADRTDGGVTAIAEAIEDETAEDEAKEDEVAEDSSDLPIHSSQAAPANSSTPIPMPQPLPQATPNFPSPQAPSGQMNYPPQQAQQYPVSPYISSGQVTPPGLTVRAGNFLMNYQKIPTICPRCDGKGYTKPYGPDDTRAKKCPFCRGKGSW